MGGGGGGAKLTSGAWPIRWAVEISDVWPDNPDIGAPAPGWEAMSATKRKEVLSRK